MEVIGPSPRFSWEIERKFLNRIRKPIECAPSDPYTDLRVDVGNVRIMDSQCRLNGYGFVYN